MSAARRWVWMGAVAIAGVLAACDGDGERELAGIAHDPAPDVGAVSLPDVSRDGEDFRFAARPGHLLVVYFGYTNCPDFCPSTLANVKLARQRQDDPSRIDVAMVTVDPGRDLAVLAGYVQSFVDDARALGTDDDARLQEVAVPFGVRYEVTEVDGETQVGHTTALYGVDDTGRLVVTWQYGTSIDDLATDFETLLSRS